MAKTTKPVTTASDENVDVPKVELPIDTYVRRRAEVEKQDHAEFEGYLRDKEQETARKAGELVSAAEVEEKRKSFLSRRAMLNVAVGTAGVAEAAVIGYQVMGTGASPGGGVQQANAPGPQRTAITREIVDTRADMKGRGLGNWVALLPTKMGGGTYAIDLNSNCVLGSIWYWNYGDYNPISHHLCAFPSSDPIHGFEFVNSTQGGQNSLIYGISTAVTAQNAPGGTIIKEIQGIGPDLQTPAITYDGKYVVCPFSGFQRQSSGIAVIDTATDTLIGILPSNGGHHDCVIIPTQLEHMKHTRSCTL